MKYLKINLHFLCKRSHCTRRHCRLGSCIRSPDCWLEVSRPTPGRSCVRPTRPRLPAVSLGPRADAELVPKFPVAPHACHVALPKINFKIFAKTQPSKHNFILSAQLLSSAAYCQQSACHHLTLFTSQSVYLANSLLLPEGRAGTAWEPSEQ
jgi:hypothetical protein